MFSGPWHYTAGTTYFKIHDQGTAEGQPCNWNSVIQYLRWDYVGRILSLKLKCTVINGYPLLYDIWLKVYCSNLPASTICISSFLQQQILDLIKEFYLKLERIGCNSAGNKCEFSCFKIHIHA